MMGAARETDCTHVPYEASSNHMSAIDACPLWTELTRLSWSTLVMLTSGLSRGDVKSWPDVCYRDE